MRLIDADVLIEEFEQLKAQPTECEGLADDDYIERIVSQLIIVMEHTEWRKNNES